MKTMYRLCQSLLCCVALFMPLSAVQARIDGLPDDLEKVWKSTGLSDSALSLVVQDVNGNVLINHNPTVPRNPASVMKMVSTWAALSTLGPEYTWRTSLMAQQGGVVDAQGSLQGPLYIKAGGDPFLTIPDLWNMLRELRMRGVKNLSDVVVDRSIFGAIATDPYAFDGAGDRPYNASPDAMVVGLGASRIVLQPDANTKQWLAFVDPPLPGVRVEGTVEWGNGSCPGSPAIATRVGQSAGNVVISLSGKAVGSCGEFSVYRLSHSQPEFFEAVFRMLWKELGGTLSRDVKAGTIPSSASALVWHDSRPLLEQIRMINKQSNNLMATLLLLSAGESLQGRGVTTASAERAVEQVLARQGINTQGWRIDNGSGLSREARLTAQGLAQMLQQVWRSNYMPEFISSLAIAGVDGTVGRRFKNSDASGRAHLKTGTLRDARALAGYVVDGQGNRYVMVSMVNDPRSDAVRPFDDALVKWLASR